MRSSAQTRPLPLALALLVVFAPLAVGPRGTAQTNTRPRRATQGAGAASDNGPAPPAGTDDARRDRRDAKERDKSDEKKRDDDDDDLKDRVEKEPTVRIGLTTTARSVTVSTTGRLLDTSDASAPPVAFQLSRVRVEPRVLPQPTLPTNEDDPLADLAAADTNADTNAPGGVAPVNPQAARRSPPDSNVDGTTSGARRDGGTRGSVRLVSRVSEATRGAVLYAPGETKPLLDTRAPLVFASDDEAQHPVRYNEKAYRGRLEVFANTRGALTVVNVVPLEEYVRGVVPNELSPGGFPEVEALKAQAVAARTYAVANLGRFRPAGFDLLPTTRSQVYGGRSTEHPLTDRAVEETRGRVATYKGEAINALYTSTCGGRTEHAEHIFGGAEVPYLRARECAYESNEPFAPHTVRTSRHAGDIKLAEHSASARDAALLAAHGFALPARVDDEWLSAPASAEDVRALLSKVAALARQPFNAIPNDANRPPAFASALARALDGESRGDVLLNLVDVAYHLSFRDADEIPERHRPDVAALLRDGHLALFPDATLRPKQTMSRARVLRAVADALEARGHFQLQKATARASNSGAFVVRPAGKSADKTLTVGPSAFLFRSFGDALFQVREVSLVGGEPLVFHADARGEVDYLEVRPAPNGAAPDHFSAYSNWAETLSPAAAQSRLGRAAANIGTLLDLRVRARGASRRVLDLELVGTSGTAHVRGGRVRSALGLREQLFVVDRLHDETGRVKTFVITGRGWGHGVGMCQVGAYGLARAGMPYEKILRAYYTGVNLTRLY